jgi:hypothetical protein
MLFFFGASPSPFFAGGAGLPFALGASSSSPVSSSSSFFAGLAGFLGGGAFGSSSSAPVSSSSSGSSGSGSFSASTAKTFVHFGHLNFLPGVAVATLREAAVSAFDHGHA